MKLRLKLMQDEDNIIMEKSMHLTPSKKIVRKILITLSFFVLTYLTYTILFIVFFRFINPAATSFISAQDNNLIDKNIVKREWVSSSQISKNIKLAAIASEDQRFKEHFGFDVKEIEDALDKMRKGKRVRGASTITQQVAKNLFLNEDKNFIRKGFEAYYTGLIEILWSKARILEVYLNIAEFGKNIYGVESASKHFFRKSAAVLNKPESALLIAVLPNPKRYSVKNPSAYLIRRQNRILRQMELMGGIETVKDL